MRDVILHAFDWPWHTIAERAAEIAALGYGAVLTPPPLYSSEHGPDWWQRYQPKDYRVLRSYLGRKRDVVRAIGALHENGVRIYADVVFNHMASEKAERDDPYHFPGADELERYGKERSEFEADRLFGDLDTGLFSPSDFNPRGDIRDWYGRLEVYKRWLDGLPDLDLNDWVIAQQRACLQALNELGFDGYRIDALKHLPVAHAKLVFERPELDDKYLFGEVLTTDERQERLFLSPLLVETDLPCYDFPLHEALRQAFAPGGSLRALVDPAARGQGLPRWRSVTFSVTHDMPHHRGFRGLLLHPRDEYLANVYLLGRDGGVPLIYSDRNESAREHPRDRDRWAGAWKRYDIAQMIHFHNAVHGALQRTVYEDDGFLVFARGDRALVAINKTAQWQAPTFTTWGLRHGRYRCQLHQDSMDLGGERFKLSIPSRQAQLWLYENR